MGARVIITRRWGAVQLQYLNTMGESDDSLLPHDMFIYKLLNHELLNHAVN
jgi:hypothetical protein